MKRAGFTMIELIFVIVILGILAAVAVPKLSATRDDAKISKMASNLSTLVGDAGSYYTSQGKTKWQAAKWADVTNLELQSGAATMNTAGAVDIQTMAYINADKTTNCFTVVTTDDGNMTIADGAQIADPVCSGAKKTAGNLVKKHTFGGVGVVR